MSGSTYIGLDVHWNYKDKYVDISMPNYIPDLLQQLVYTPKKQNILPIYTTNQCTEQKYNIRTMKTKQNTLIKKELSGYKKLLDHYSTMMEQCNQ